MPEKRKMEYKTYLFDFDYTLADSSRGIVICFRNVLTRHGHTDITDESIKRTIGKTLEDSFSILTGITDKNTLISYKKEYVKEADIHMTANTKFFPETVAVLKALKKRGAQIGIISTKYRYRIHEMVDQHFPNKFFDIIIGGEDVKKAKPSPQGLLKALRCLHRKKKDTLYIGDSIIDAQTALLAGVDFVGVLNGMTTREELAEYRHRQILPDLTLLPLINKETTPPLLQRLVPHKALIYYRLLHQKQIRGKKELPKDQQPHTCKNCRKTFQGNFCPDCGQTQNTPRFTIRNAFQNILSGFFNIDNGFSRNLLEFLYRPGYMIRDYIDGKRVHYFKPFQSLFVLAALYIMFVQLIDPEALKNRDKEYKETPTYEQLIDNIKEQKEYAIKDSARIYLGQSLLYADSARIADTDITMEDKINVKLKDKPDNTRTATDDNDDIVDDLTEAGIAVGVALDEYKENFLSENKYISAVYNLMRSWIHGNKAFCILLLLPVFTLASRWSFRKSLVGHRFNLTEQFFAQVYIACQILWISLLILPFTREAHLNDIFDLSYEAIFLLFVWDYRQLFNLSWWKSFKRTTVMFCYCALIMLLAATLFITLLATIAYLR